jgi:outer membrane protein assembly factor BamB
MKRLISIFALSLLIISCSKNLIFKDTLINQNEYDQFGNIPQRNFYYPISISDSLQEIWQSSGYGSNTNTSITIYADILFSPELAGNVVGFNLDNGKELGARKSSGQISHSAVVDRMRIIYCVNQIKENYGILYFYDFIKGEIINSIRINGGISNELIKLKDGIIAVTDFGEVIKYNFLGSELWNTKTKAITLSDPASDEKDTFIANSNGEIISIDNETGKINYRKEFNSVFESGIIIKDKKLFLGNNEGILFCLNSENGDIIWSFDSNNKIVMTPILDDRNIYFGNLNGDFYSINYSSGKINWQFNSGGLFNASGLVFNNLIIQPDLNKKLLIINKQDGKIIRSKNYNEKVKMSPVFYDNKIYVGVDRGEIVAYKLEIIND